MATAPTEAEIRALLTEANEDIGAVVYDFTRLVHHVPRSERGPAYVPGLWEDLRPSEQERLETLLEECYALEEPIRQMVLDRVTAACLAFAHEYPDAKRVPIAEAVA